MKGRYFLLFILLCVNSVCSLSSFLNSMASVFRMILYKTAALPSDLKIEQRNGSEITLSLENYKSTSLSSAFLSKLTTVRDCVCIKFNKHYWKKLLRSQLKEKTKNETLELVKRTFVASNLEDENIVSGLKDLALFDKHLCPVYTVFMPFSLQLALDLGYAKTDVLYDYTFTVFWKDVYCVNYFLNVFHTEENNNTDANRVYNFILNYIEHINEPLHVQKEKYSILKRDHTLKWNATSAVLQKLFTKERFLAVQKHVSAFNASYILNSCRALLTLRILEYPHEESYYRDLLSLSTREDYENSDPTIQKSSKSLINIELAYQGSVSSYVLACNWIKLIIYNDTRIDSVFYNEQDRVVEFLELRQVLYNTGYALTTTRNKIVVRDTLTLNRIKGEINVVDVSTVKSMVVTSSRLVRFYNDSGIQRFNCVKTLCIEDTSLYLFVDNEGRSLFPNLEVLRLRRCLVTKNICSMIVPSVVSLYISECLFDEEITEKKIEERMANKSLFVTRVGGERLFRVFFNEETIVRIKRENDVINLRRYNGKSIKSTLSVNELRRVMNDAVRLMNDAVRVIRDDVRVMNEESTLPNEEEGTTSEELKNRKRHTVNNRILFLDSSYTVNISLLRSVQDIIVFLEVSEFYVYVNLKAVCPLDSLRYLSVLVLSSNHKRVRKLEDRPHRLEALSISKITKRGLEVLVKERFARDTLFCLDLSYSGYHKTKENLIFHFANTKVLSVKITNKLCYTEFVRIIRGIRRLTGLKTLELVLEQVNRTYKERREFFDLLEETLGFCKELREIRIYESEIQKVELDDLRQALVRDGRTYSLRIRLCSGRRRVYGRSIGEVSAANKELQEKILIEDAVRGEFIEEHNRNTRVEVRYVLDGSY